MSPRVLSHPAAVRPAPKANAAAANALQVGPAGWRDLPAIFQLIVQGSRAGHFSPLYGHWRVRTGLALQLLRLQASGCIGQPGSPPRPATLSVIRQADGPALGFALLAAPTDRDATPAHKLCLFAVRADQRGQGLGRRLLATVLAALPAHARVLADCLPASQGMARLLRRQGFTALPADGGPVQHWLRRAVAGQKHSGRRSA